MAFQAKLTFEGKEYDVKKCNYKLRRDVDPKGRPSSEIYGGTIDVTIESTEDSAIAESMVNQFKPCSGSVVFNRGDQDSKMKELTWSNGYVVAYEESLDVIGKQPMLLSFQVSAQKIQVGGAEIEQNWPTDK